jgi:hypothetical protein
LGGSGVGETSTLLKAEALLLERARSYCAMEIKQAQQEIAHYEAQLALLKDGLQTR